MNSTTATTGSVGPQIAPDVRRANRRLLVAMALFAVVLCATVLLWMYGRMARQREAERAADRVLQTEPAAPAAPANPSPSPVAPR